MTRKITSPVNFRGGLLGRVAQDRPAWDDPGYVPDWQELEPTAPTDPAPDRGGLLRLYPDPDDGLPDRHPYLMPIPIPAPEDRAYRLPALPEQLTLQGERDARQALRNQEFERPKTAQDIGLPPLSRIGELRALLNGLVGPGTAPGRLGETFRQWYWPDLMRPDGWRTGRR